jgi:hypothetical protein
MSGFALLLGILNVVFVILLFIQILYIIRKISDLENAVRALVQYRIDNEVQLDNLIKDINKNDKFLAERIRPDL